MSSATTSVAESERGNGGPVETENRRAINEHYGRERLGESILEAIRATGRDIDALSADDLAPIEEFHIGGRDATVRLAEAAGVEPGTRVIDIGAGIGGPARTLASRYGAVVTGIDLTAEYVEAGNLLSEKVGLRERVTLEVGSGLDLPCEDGSFDLAWTQHVTMNVPDKAALFAEVARVLAPGGRYALHEIFAGPKPATHFPVPWTPDESLHHLVAPEAVRERLEEAGFEVERWEDRTEHATEWFRSALARAAKEGPPPLGLATLVGADFPRKAKNVLANLEEDRLRVVQAVLGRRGGVS